jgi:sugar (pentulose or hexulose) kinase
MRECGIIENLLTLAEDVFVLWAAENLHLPQFSRIGFVPEEERDATKPVKEWWQSCCAALESCLKQVDASRIDAMAIVHQRETVAFLDPRAKIHLPGDRLAG